MASRWDVPPAEPAGPAEEEQDCTQLWSRELPLLVFRLLSNRDRARLACTCRGLREAVAHPSLAPYLLVSREDSHFRRLLLSAARLAAPAGGLLDIEVQDRYFSPSGWFNLSSASTMAGLRGHTGAVRRLVMPPSFPNLSLVQAEELEALTPLLERGRAQLILSAWPLAAPCGDPQLLLDALRVHSFAERVWRARWNSDVVGSPPPACLQAWKDAEETAARLAPPPPLPLSRVLELSLAVSRAEGTDCNKVDHNPWLATSPLRRLLDCNPAVPLHAISLHRKGISSVSGGSESDVLAMLYYLHCSPSRCAQLRCLDLRDVRLSVAGGSMLAELLASGQLPVLEELWINDTSKAPQLGLYSAAAGLASMQRLDLSYCPLGETGGRALAEGLRARAAAGAPPLSLCLHHTESRDGLGDAGLEALLHALPAIAELNVRRNGISCRGAVALAEALAMLGAGAALRTLDLEANNIRDKGALALARVLSHQLAMRQLVISGNMVRAEGAAALAASAACLGDRQAALGSKRCVLVLGEAAVSQAKKDEAWARWEAQAAAMRAMQMGSGAGAAAAPPAAAAAAAVGVVAGE